MNTINFKKIATLLLAITLLGSIAAPVARADEKDDAMAKLKERFKERFPQLKALKTAGKIGETYLGYVEAVKAGEAEGADLVTAENADRKELYQLLADKEKVTPDVVAQRNAARNFQRADKGEYLKYNDGQWKQKE